VAIKVALVVIRHVVDAVTTMQEKHLNKTPVIIWDLLL
jgi:hypothetical protein